MSARVRKAIMRQKKKKLSERQQTLQEWPNRLCGRYILKKEECAGENNNFNMPGRLRKTTKVDDHNIIYWVKNKNNKNKTLYIIETGQGYPGEVCVSLTNSTIKR